MTTAARLPLTGLRVLIPRGGDLGDRLADAVTRHGGEPFIAPIIDFRMPDPARMAQQFERLNSGSFDWLAVTSTTTVAVLVDHDVTIPSSTRVAVVGPATGGAMEAAGFRIDFMPQRSFSAQGMLSEWPEPAAAGSPGSILIPQSAIAEPTLANGLTARGFAVTTVTAYETSVIPWAESIRRRAAAGDFDAVLLTSGSVARAVAAEGIPANPTVVACIGESTAVGARAAGLPAHAVATTSTAEGLVAALISHLSSPRTEA